jgi:spoIIIJ-associated protein
VEPKEYQGKTVDLAIQKACEELRVSREELEINVISEGYRGIFGLVGGKEARVLVSLKQAPANARKELVFNRSTSPELKAEVTISNSSHSDKAIQAKSIVETILDKICPPALVQVVKDDDTIQLNITGDCGGLLIEKNGQTLDALQYLVNKIVNRSPENRKPIVLDTRGYREKRVNSLTEMALQLGKKAKKLGRPVTTGLMNPYERRIVHLTLKNDGKLTTKSQGDGINRKIVISPKN